MPAYENHAGINITGSKLQISEIIYQNEQFILENVDEAYYIEQIDFTKDKETKILSLLQGAFNELLIKKSLSSNLVSFTLPFELFNLIQVPYDNTLLHQDLVEEFKWELSVLYPHLSVKDLVIQYIDLEKSSIVNYNTAVVIAVSRRYLQIISNFCTDNNLKIKFIDNCHFASENALGITHLLKEKGLVLSLFLTGKFLSLILSFRGKAQYFKVIQFTDASEVVKLLKEELKPNEMHQVRLNMIDEAYICGDDISHSFVEKLEETLGISFNQFNPYEKIKTNPALSGNKCYREKYNSFTASAGISFRLA